MFDMIRYFIVKIKGEKNQFPWDLVRLIMQAIDKDFEARKIRVYVKRVIETKRDMIGDMFEKNID